jgi:hypothetical protein
MNREEAYIILDALAEGCSPFTGEVLEDHPILNERKVIRALQVALDSLNVKPQIAKQQTVQVTAPAASIKLDQDNLMQAVNAIKAANIIPSEAKLVKFFLGSRLYKGSEAVNHSLYSSLRHQYTYSTLKPLLTQAVTANKAVTVALASNNKIKPWDSVDLFEKPVFCTLSERAVEQLKSKVKELGIVKLPTDLSEGIINARRTHPRAYELWSDKEQEYLTKALAYTNDLKLLSDCFQRGANSIVSIGKRLVYEGKVSLVTDRSDI